MDESQVRDRIREALGGVPYPTDLGRRIEERLERPEHVWRAAARRPLPARDTPPRPAAAAAAVLLAVAVVALLMAPRLHAGAGGNTVPASRTSQPGPGSAPGRAAPPAAGSRTWFVSAVVGWTVTDAGILGTRDGGVHWTVQQRLDGAPATVAGMRFLDEAHGFLLLTGGQDSPRLLVTGDGQHWTRRLLPDGTRSAAGMDFVSPLEGWALVASADQGPPHLLHTVDAGVTWATLDAQGLGPATLTGLRFVDRRYGWATAREPGGSPGAAAGWGTPLLYATADGGATWQPQPLVALASRPWPQPEAAADPPVLFDGSHGVCAARLATTDDTASRQDLLLVYSTADGGRTWGAPARLPLNADRWTAAGPRHWWAAGPAGVWRSADAGRTWTGPFATPERFGGLDFIDDQTGFAEALTGPAHYRTSDGGRTWTRADA